MLGRSSISGRSSIVETGPVCCSVEESSGIVAEETLICSAVDCSVICSVWTTTLEYAMRMVALVPCQEYALQLFALYAQLWCA